MKLAIVLPTLGEGQALIQALQGLQVLRAQGVQLIVVDGDSHPAVVAGTTMARALADRVLSAPRGRASQMNAGAWAARHSAHGPADVLLFLHVDTRLPGDGSAAIAAIQRAIEQGAAWGRFDVAIDAGEGAPVCWRMGLALVAAMMNRRSRMTGVATGDQAIWVRREAFERLGGFALQPLMEDIDWSTRARRAGLGSAPLDEIVTTSGRRWRQHGFVRTIVTMWRLRWAYWRGADAHGLARAYGYVPRAGAAVAIVAKAPLAGVAKTRLIPALGAVGAARAQRRFALRAWRTVRAAAIGPVVFWCAPSAAARFFRALARAHGVQCRDQPAGDLGQRMAAAVDDHFARSRQPLILIGTDCPVLAESHLQAAADALLHDDVVVIPAEDGGYVLLGLRRPVAAVFERIDWSTSRVMAQTRERLREAGLRVRELPALWDVDDPEDWARWQNWQARQDPRVVSPGVVVVTAEGAME